MNKEYLDKVSRETLYVFINNDKYIINSLRERLFKLTGCRDFGNVDGMNGSCILSLTKNKIYVIIKKKKGAKNYGYGFVYFSREN